MSKIKKIDFIVNGQLLTFEHPETIEYRESFILGENLYIDGQYDPTLQTITLNKGSYDEETQSITL